MSQVGTGSVSVLVHDTHTDEKNGTANRYDDAFFPCNIKQQKLVVASSGGCRDQ